MSTQTAATQEITYLEYEHSGFFPTVQLKSTTCTLDLTCKGVTTPVDDKQPIKAGVELFRLRQIPNTMKKLGLNTAANLQEKWFNGQASVMTEKQKSGRDPYDEAFVDTTTISMGWLQSFSRVQEKIRTLTQESYLLSPKAQDEIRKLLINNGITPSSLQMMTQAAFTPEPPPLQILTPWQGKMSQNFHRHWQFQQIGVDQTKLERAQLLAKDSDDLFAALGAFSLNAAISKAEVRRASWNVFEITITEIVVYARDTYDFTDDDDTGSNSEYLGHWNKDDLIRLPPYALLQFLDEPVVLLGAPLTQEHIRFCVRNRHYRQWRKNTQKRRRKRKWQRFITFL
jgi:hypothetical protein